MDSVIKPHYAQGQPQVSLKLCQNRRRVFCYGIILLCIVNLCPIYTRLYCLRLNEASQRLCSSPVWTRVWATPSLVYFGCRFTIQSNSQYTKDNQSLSINEVKILSRVGSSAVVTASTIWWDTCSSSSSEISVPKTPEFYICWVRRNIILSLYLSVLVGGGGLHSWSPASPHQLSSWKPHYLPRHAHQAVQVYLYTTNSISHFHIILYCACSHCVLK